MTAFPEVGPKTMERPVCEAGNLGDNSPEPVILRGNSRFLEKYDISMRYTLLDTLLGF
jgi:hypothetical protein